MTPLKKYVLTERKIVVWVDGATWVKLDDSALEALSEHVGDTLDDELPSAARLKEAINRDGILLTIED